MSKIIETIYQWFLVIELLMVGVIQGVVFMIAWALAKLHFKYSAIPFGMLYFLCWFHIYSICETEDGIDSGDLLNGMKAKCKCKPGDGISEIFDSVHEAYMKSVS